MPKVSIVLPTYNGERYINESVESVISQTFQDWELIIVDDCSSDRTGEVVDRLAGTDDRIRVIHNKVNENLPNALNIGFRKAKGKYLTWTSDDNKYLSNALEAMVRFLDSNLGYSMVCTGILLFDANWKFLGEFPVYTDDMMFLGDVVGASFMYRREVLDKVGEYDPDMFCVEDYEYWVRILENGCRIGYLDGVYYLYRIHDQSLSASKKEKVMKQRVRLYIKHLDWILGGIHNNIRLMMYKYEEIIRDKDIEFSAIRARFSDYLPLLKYDEPLPENVKYCLYGAGVMGRKMLEKLGRDVEFFVDRNNNIAGNIIDGIPVLHVSNLTMLMKKNKDLHIVISVDHDKQYEVMEYLVNNGIKSFSVKGHVM